MYLNSGHSTVTYAGIHKFLYERHLAAKDKDSTAIDENIAPALIALSLPHSQRADALGITHAIFSSHIGVFDGREHSAGSLIRTATFLHARNRD
jgi:hypothetical protein